MEPEHSGGYFCVFKGWVPGIYTTVEEVQEQMDDYDDKCWKHYETLKKAQYGWEKYFGLGNHIEGRRRIQEGSAPMGIQPAIRREKEHMAIHIMKLHYKQYRETMFENLKGDDFVPDPPASPSPLISPSLQDWLLKVCKQLSIPDPIYRSVVGTAVDARRCYRYLVALVPPESATASVLCSRISFDPAIAHEDAARVGLDMLSRLLGRPIHDYNFEVVDKWKDRFTELSADLEAIEAKLDYLNYPKNQLEDTLDSIGRAHHPRGGRGRTSRRRG